MATRGSQTCCVATGTCVRHSSNSCKKASVANMQSRDIDAARADTLHAIQLMTKFNAAIWTLENVCELHQFFKGKWGQEYRCLVTAVMQARCECLVIIPNEQALRSAPRSTRYEAAGHTVARVGRSTRVPTRVRS